jgi:hypothetical protein
MYLQGLEANTTKNPQNLNNITGSYNSDTGLYQGAFTLPVALGLTSQGRAEFAAQEYLLT